MADDQNVFAPPSTSPITPAGTEVGDPSLNGARPHPEHSSGAIRRSELSVFLGWFAGLVLVLVCGWGLLYLAYYLTQANKRDFELPLALASLFSLGFFFLLEQNLWLSRLMGLRIGPHSATWKSALLLWVFGVPGLLFRSSATYQTATAADPADEKDKKPKETLEREPLQQVDSIREIIETVVFVVVLVLMLKSFAAEAFVIPTGSMATTLLGYQKDVVCPQCGFEFPVNCSSEVDPQDNRQVYVVGCQCPNCRQPIYFSNTPPLPRDMAEDAARNIQHFKDAHSDAIGIPDPGWNSGDRVLVAKFVYDLFGNPPDRLDVVVFKYPAGPQKNHVPMNYIKRLIGLPGETIAIHNGKLFVLSAEKSPKYEDTEEAKHDPKLAARLWKRDPPAPEHDHTHPDDPVARERFDQGQFTILRKPPEAILAMRRIVYDNDHPPKDGQGGLRWAPSDGWKEDGRGFRIAAGEKTESLRYQHILRGKGNKPRLITDNMGYNTWEPHPAPGENWVGDLILECEVTLEKAQGELVLELGKGVDRFNARWDLTTGDCTLVRLSEHKPEEKLATRPTALKKPGTYRLRFANVDEKLIVWVDSSLPFDNGVIYDAPKEMGATQADLEPAIISARGASMTVRKLSLWRDTYYTANAQPSSPDSSQVDIDNPETWRHLKHLPVRTMYVQPGHFLCLGDNSPESSDGRSWGLVPERLMLGKALLVYYPFSRAGRIR
jgi:signal peptidase I